MTLQREQIDAVLDDIATSAMQRVRADPDDSAVSQQVVERTRQLLREVSIEHHLHICDTAQHLLLTLGLDDDDEDEGEMPPPNVLDDPADVSLELLDDPFDVDAFVSGDAREDAGEAAATDCAPVAVEQDRRGQVDAAGEAALRRGLTDKQLATLDTMSHFGWALRFVRRPMFLPPVPVAFDRNRQRYVVVEPDGSVDEDPGLQIRD